MDRNRRITFTSSAEETIEYGQQIGQNIHSGTIICLFGDLGVGKTTLIKGIVQAVTKINPEQIHSPTYTYLNIYEGLCPVYHFDLYRLRDAEDFLSLGFEEYLGTSGICCIEWSEKIASLLPENTIQITLSHINETKRQINTIYHK